MSYIPFKYYSRIYPDPPPTGERSIWLHCSIFLVLGSEFELANQIAVFRFSYVIYDKDHYDFLGQEVMNIHIHIITIIDKRIKLFSSA